MQVKLTRHNKLKVFFSAMLALTIAFSIIGLPACVSAAGKLTYQDLIISLGNDESELMFTWYAAQRTGRVAIRAQGDGKYKKFTAVNTYRGGQYIHKATVTGLKPSTVYDYMLIGENGTASGVHTVKTGNPSNFSFIAVGDAQIDANNLAASGQGWGATVNKAAENFPVSFLVSMGDQVDNISPDNTSAEYTTYLSPCEFTGLPASHVMGNHEFYHNSQLFADHFSFPNRYAADEVNYWYRYGNALFMILDSNYKNIATHRNFLDKAIASNRDAKWRIVAFHESLYSEGAYINHSASYRTSWISAFDELGIDVALSGHDHSYTRTYQMLGNKPRKDQVWIDSAGNLQSDPTAIRYNTVLNPTGTLYITLNSSSGNKYYSFSAQAPAYFSAARHQYYKPEFSIINITENMFNITTYQSDTMAVLDNYTIVKDMGVITTNPFRDVRVTD